MAEEKITFKVTDLMKLPPSFCTSSLENKDIFLNNTSLTNFFKEHNVFSFLTRIKRCQILKTFFENNTPIAAAVLIKTNPERTFVMHNSYIK